jgi:hypothetical protein
LFESALFRALLAQNVTPSTAHDVVKDASAAAAWARGNESMHFDSRRAGAGPGKRA